MAAPRCNLTISHVTLCQESSQYGIDMIILSRYRVIWSICILDPCVALWPICNTMRVDMPESCPCAVACRWPRYASDMDLYGSIWIYMIRYGLVPKATAGLVPQPADAGDSSDEEQDLATAILEGTEWWFAWRLRTAAVRVSSHCFILVHIGAVMKHIMLISSILFNSSWKPHVNIHIVSL